MKRRGLLAIESLLSPTLMKPNGVQALPSSLFRKKLANKLPNLAA